jgi:hypothetical protein
MSPKKVGVVAALLLVLISAEVISHFTTPLGGVALDGKLTKVQEKAVDLLVDLAKLFITFAYGLLGAISYFITKSDEGSFYRSTRKIAMLVGSAAAAIASIYWGHIIITSIITMLSNDFLTLDSESIVWAVRLQYFCVVVGLMLLVGYVLSHSERIANSTHALHKSSGECGHRREPR